MAELTFVRQTGKGFLDVFEDLAALRIAVFRDFPYLYEGTTAYEKAYLQTYVQSERAFLFAVYDGSIMVGATTCIPLSDETPEVQQPFQSAGYALDDIFYFGESILRSEYRGHGLGHRFFDEREAHARSFGTYKSTCFCAVDRPSDHPLRPVGYQPLDTFWHKRGYQKAPALHSTFTWKDLNESTESPKKMTYWLNTVCLEFPDQAKV